MTPEEFRRYGHRFIDWLADYHEGIGDRPVMAKTRPGEIRDSLPPAPPTDPEDFAAVIADLDRARRDRALLAIEPGGDRGRRGGDRLAAADAWAFARLERRPPGHRIDQHACRPDLRPRAGDQLCSGARRNAGRNLGHLRIATFRVGFRPGYSRRREPNAVRFSLITSALFFGFLF